MKVIHFNTHSTAGGAAKVAYQLHLSLLKEGLDSIFLVKYKTKVSDLCIEIAPVKVKGSLISTLKKIFQKSLFGLVYRKLFLNVRNELENVSTTFNSNTDYFTIASIKEHLLGADIICLHWIDDFLSTKMVHAIQRNTDAPIVWTLMDVEPLTGGCHYTEGCDGFKKSCGNCPQLKSEKENDFSRGLWNKKKLDLQKLDITFVAGSSWIKDRIKESSLFSHKPIEKILVGVDKTIFKKGDKAIARTVLDLPREKKIIFFGAQSLNDKRKGMEFLAKALANLSKMTNHNKKSDILLMVAGFGINEWNNDFEFKNMGFIYDERILALCYQSSDVFACPSIDDAGPMMINQAIMCGTPVVAFNSGVAPDLITSEERGYLVKMYDSEDFCTGLHKILFNAKGLNEGKWIQPDECKPEVQAKKYHMLFKTILDSHEKR
ncbi:MAG: glycosyltransferase [Bacteroidetes bacterium]|nr:glycosyltransferase [Bacteroidota bacterium]